jgi:hypothetical protein
MFKQTLKEAITLLEAARKCVLDAHKDITDTSEAVDWELAGDVIEIARSVDNSRCRLKGLLEVEDHAKPLHSPPLTAVKNTRRSKSDYSVRGDIFIKSGSTWEHTLNKSEFAKAIQAIKDIAYKSSETRAAYSLAEVVKATRVSKRYVYDIYTCLEELGLVDKQHQNVFSITKKQADALEIEDIWRRIKMLSEIQS